MPSIETIAFSVFLSLAAGSTAFADVQVSIRDGQVSIVARGATAGQILAEWARVGRTQVVNVEQAPRDLMTIELRNVSEEQALDVVLRRASGYVAAPRAVAVANASRFDRILVMPPSVARPAANASATQAARQPSSAPPTYVSAPPTYETPEEYPQQPSTLAATEPAVNDAADEQPLVTVVGGSATTPSPRPQLANTTRQALETVDPRQFFLLMQKQAQGGAGTYPPTGYSPPGDMQPRGVAVPGTLVQPPPRQTGVPGQPPLEPE